MSDLSELYKKDIEEDFDDDEEEILEDNNTPLR